MHYISIQTNIQTWIWSFTIHNNLPKNIHGTYRNIGSIRSIEKPLTKDLKPADLWSLFSQTATVNGGEVIKVMHLGTVGRSEHRRFIETPIFFGKIKYHSRPQYFPIWSSSNEKQPSKSSSSLKRTKHPKRSVFSCKFQLNAMRNLICVLEILDLKQWCLVRNFHLLVINSV